jgi:hypothetical protein
VLASITKKGEIEREIVSIFPIIDFCNTSGVTMARAHLGTKDCDHMWYRLKETHKNFGDHVLIKVC